ncbi:MAG: virulence RhuM family protein [Rhodocyclaceae bacterium]|nr:virulence RhuM family protein [Rhodocyclaceae bacterium]
MVNVYLDLAEISVRPNMPMKMEDCVTRLYIFLEFTDRQISHDDGKVSAERTKAHVESKFEKYRIAQDRLFGSDFDRVLKQIHAKGRSENGDE